MKWQHITLRVIFGKDELTPDMFTRTQHFFRYPDFEQWSFHNHGQKIPNPNNWLLHKSPLKQFIYEFTKDKRYRFCETKAFI
ncbi:hypothetical protein BWQ96_03522 [Gracilariopsis chorda]|uniref:Uncharacterized protein n=1 Tax=Gracilariopsis chorda TaxID=448386 RepID=A0A2V3IX15_9FLOR|nr:hypothetical protein BWQ96_03522 [Gracilariopsis chorda]|eukprot:PXF46696.1 hypothetical protein BWQ96_03522 [Gracilariopsis chorda]